MNRKQNKQNTMDPFEWARHEELVASIPGAIDIGVGREVIELTGLLKEEVCLIYKEMFHKLIDGGADLTMMHCPNGKQVKVYVRRRGRHVDIGTRSDFTDLGWEEICDIVDAQGR